MEYLRKSTKLSVRIMVSQPRFEPASAEYYARPYPLQQPYQRLLIESNNQLPFKKPRSNFCKNLLNFSLLLIMNYSMDAYRG
jgi:hypothetical protein